ncbi:BTAD domain-containing putative transcriptional regulator [Actinomadura sp. SCN-SB]|uniref:AfsR/SARP family transcriptional regulator n=1 Tax=Actinomadura sp. SCN-SB TaxID=3373092 RepID=UPI0037521C3F
MEMPQVTTTFAVLGPPRGRRGSEELPLGPPQQRAMLTALLLREGRPATAQELVNAVWGDAPPERAVGALRTYASRLRRLLEPDHGRDRPYRLLVSVGDGYALRLPPEALDVARFERDVAAAEEARSQGRPAQARELLRSALGLWRGTPLSGVPGPYARAQRIRLTERRLAALESRLELDLELGDHAEIIGELTALVAEHPLRERLRGLLMLALHGAGRPAEALEVYAETRRTLIEDLGIEPGHDLSALHRRLLTETGHTPAPPAPRAKAAGAAPPAQLPRDVPDFTGRERLVDELREVLLTEPRRTVPMVAIAGPGGVGKTALALHVAHLVRSGFPDGQLYSDLRGAGDEPADPHAVLGAFLQALGVDRDAIPAGPAERAALYRTRLAERRVLVVLDDARDARQIRPLLPGGPSCAVLITSRSKLAGLGAARPVDLDVMEPHEARALASRIAGADRLAAEPAAARALLAACGHLPLAVRIVAARLAARPAWTVESLVGRLADRRRTLAELRVADLAVEAVFQLGYNQLDDAQKRAFRLLALAESPTFSGDAAAALLGLPACEAEGLCEALVDANLLRSPTAGRYGYHDLLQLYARQCAERDEPQAERQAAQHRLFHFYLATARNAQLTVNPGDGRAQNPLLPAAVEGLSFGSSDAARDWFFAEAPALFAAIAHAARGPAALLPLAADLLLLTDTLVTSGVHAKECEQAAHAVIDGAWDRRDARSEGRAHLHLGRLYFYADRFDDTAAVSRVALRRGRDTADLWIVADALALLGGCDLIMGRDEDALRHYIEALDAFRRIGDRYGEAGALGAVARALLALGRPEDALISVEHGLALHQELGGGRTGFGLYHLGVILHHIGRYAEAMARQQEAVTFFRARRNRQWEGLARYRVAEARLALDQPEEAVRDARSALRILRENRHSWGQGHALRVLADALEALEDHDEARARREEALELFERIRVPDAQRMRELLKGSSGCGLSTRARPA